MAFCLSYFLVAVIKYLTKMTRGKKCLFWLTVPGYSQCPVAGKASGQEHDAKGHITATVKKQKRGMNDTVHIAFSFTGSRTQAQGMMPPTVDKSSDLY